MEVEVTRTETINLLPDDEVTIRNGTDKPVAVHIEKREWSIIGKIFNKIIGRK